jgi:hypothetical protein
MSQRIEIQPHRSTAAHSIIQSFKILKLPPVTQHRNQSQLLLPDDLLLKCIIIAECRVLRARHILQIERKCGAV